jgi:hypothetical protein
MVHQRGRRRLAQAGGQTPRLFHALGMHTDHRTDLLAFRRHPRVAQLARTSVLAHPSGRRPGQAARVGHTDVAAEADDVVKAQLAQEGEQLLVAEAAVSQDGDAASWGDDLGQPPQAAVLVHITSVLQFVLPDSQPYQWRGPPMAGGHAQHQRRLVVVVEIGPVHRHQYLLALADLVRHPAGKAVPDVDAVVAQQPVHLLDRVFCLQSLGLGQRLANQRDRQRGRRHRAERRRGKGIDPFGVQLRPVEFADESPHIFEAIAALSKPCHVLLQPAVLARTPTDTRRIAPIAHPTEMRGFVRPEPPLDQVSEGEM